MSARKCKRGSGSLLVELEARLKVKVLLKFALIVVITVTTAIAIGPVSKLLQDLLSQLDVR